MISASAKYLPALLIVLAFALSDVSADSSALDAPPPIPALELADDVEFLPSQDEITQFGSGMIAVTLYIQGRSVIRLLDLDRRRALKFDSRLSSASFASFSAGGEFLAFEGQTGPSQQIFVSRWDGSGQRQITSAPSLAGNPTWTRDGGLVFFWELPTGQRELARAALPEGGSPLIEQISNKGGRNTTPAESPGTGLIAYSTDCFFPGWDVCLLNTRTGGENCPLGSTKETFCRPRWSPSGAQIVISKGQGYDIDLFLYTVKSGALERLTDLLFKEYDAEFSPAGESIAFTNEASGDEHYDLWLLRLSDKKMLHLARSEGSLRFPSWTFSREYELAPNDECPDDPLKLEPGVCGCGSVDGPAVNGEIQCGEITSANPEPEPPGVHQRKVGEHTYRVTLRYHGSQPGPFEFVMQRGGVERTITTHRNKARYLINPGRKVRFALAIPGAPRSAWTPWKVVGEVNAFREF